MVRRSTVLIADGNDTDRFLLTSIMQAEGYAVESVASGGQALQRFDQIQPQLVLIDVLLPDVKSWEVAKQIREKAGERYVPVVFLTSLRSLADSTHWEESNGDDYLTKPYHSVMLRAKLAAIERQRNTHDTVLAQRDLITRLNAYLLQEQAAAKAIMDRVVHTGSLDSHNISYLMSPLALFNGDVLLAEFNPGGDLVVFVGDFTGHGLTAGIGAMPLADVFYSMIRKGFSIADLMRESNRKLAHILPAGYFCCATVVRISYTKGILEYWNGGLPAGYLIRDTSSLPEPASLQRPLEKLESSHLPLGILVPEKFSGSTQMLEFSAGDQLFLFTDGLLETRDADGNMFGDERLEVLLAESMPIGRLFENVQQAVREKQGNTARDDDVTAISVELLPPSEQTLIPLATTIIADCVPQQWQFNYELGPASLREFNPLPLLHQIILEVPELRESAGQIYAVLAEAYSNALEHGVLGLKSLDKQDASGFADYYQRRERALDGLSEGYVRFQFDCSGSHHGGELRIRVSDSGPGFDHASRIAAVDSGDYSDRYHGRGLPLLKRMCESVHYPSDGSEVMLTLCWQTQTAQVA